MEKEIIKQLTGQDYLDYIEQWKLDNKELIKSGKCKKLFYENLPKKKFGDGYSIVWKNSIGYKMFFIYNDIEDWLEIIEHDSTYIRNIITISYKNKLYKIKAQNLKQCSLGVVLEKRTKEFKIEIGQTFKDDKRDITIIDRKYIKSPYNKNTYLKYYKYKCKKCGFDGGKHYSIKDRNYKDEYWILENNLINGGCGCSCCCFPPKIVVQRINDIATTDKWMVPLIGENESKKHTSRSEEIINVTCNNCKKDKKVMICDVHRYHSIQCNCGDSYSRISKMMFDLLNQLKENNMINNFETEKRFDWCKYYNPYKNKKSYGVYDFFIKELNLIIETDGDFHRKDNLMSRQTKEESQWIDNIKDELAKENGYKVIRISDEGDIEENIKISLNYFLNLKKINWERVITYSLSNLVKTACDYKRNNPNLSTTDIGNIMGYTGQTIKNWLKQGNGIWVCYDAKEEMIRRNKSNRKSTSPRKIEVFKNGISYGLFRSIKNLSNNSEELFGIHFTELNIRKSINGGDNVYEGYIFKEIN